MRAPLRCACLRERERKPAEFLSGSPGIVRWTNFTEDIRIRARADEMLAAAKGLK
jgi:hypothetical protein